MEAGDPGTPLARKLGITEADTLMLLGSPPDLRLDLPPGVTVRRQARGRADVVVVFVTSSRVLHRRIDTLARITFPDGALWVAWPKRSSGVATDVTDLVARDIALPRGLVDNKVCAVDSTWTALRFVWRRERRR